MPGSKKTEIDAQKKTLHASQAESDRVQQLRVEYWQALGEIEPDNL